jgi:DNA-binding CsgD family transcriptional regulator
MQTDRAILDALERGRAAYCRRAWADAYRALSLVDQARPLDRDDLERMGTCAYLTGRDGDFQRILQRAHQLNVTVGDPARAARVAFWLGLTGLLRGDKGIATGWLSRAGRLIKSRDCVEHGYLLLPVAEQHLAERNSAAAHAAASSAAAIGQRFGDSDLVACARHLEGRALLNKGTVHTGLALLDEAMLAAMTGELSPIFTGLIYCSVIDACQKVCALSRAREWTAALSTWCEQQPDMLAFTGTCLVHRAEILFLEGAWRDAMSEAARACERGARTDQRPPAAALYLQGEILRLQGNASAAEEAYRSASRMGYEPQPGLALLLMTQGRLDAACATIRRVVTAATDPFERAKLLPAYIEIMLSAAAAEEARSACAELEELAENIDTDVVHAFAAHARGAVELANGDGRAALVRLRGALQMWQQLAVPYAGARVRVLLGAVCRSLGDAETAELQFGAARTDFEQLKAAPDLVRLNAIAQGQTSHQRLLLTPRELEVLRRIAAGKTNKIIAREWKLSERTIDRHVSNILTKLDVPSRAAAIAYAYDHKLFSPPAVLAEITHPKK